MSDRECPAEVRAAAAKFGIDLGSHRSSIVNRNAIERADAILLFDFDDLFKLFSRYPGALGKALFVGAFRPRHDIVISDPTKRAEAVLGSALKAIADSIEQFAELFVRSDDIRVMEETSIGEFERTDSGGSSAVDP